jgi:hypothetical protein
MRNIKKFSQLDKKDHVRRQLADNKTGPVFKNHHPGGRIRLK